LGRNLAQADAAHAGNHRQFPPLASPRNGTSDRDLSTPGGGERKMMFSCRFRYSSSPSQRMRAPLGLTLRRRYRKTIQLIAHLDLTRQPRIRPHVETEVPHVL